MATAVAALSVAWVPLAGCGPTISQNAPTAHAGFDQSVATGSVVTLDGSLSSDLNRDPLTYFWSFIAIPVGSAAALNGAATLRPTFYADRNGAYVAQLVVSDAKQESDPDSVTVTADGNTPPDANAGADLAAYPGTAVTLDGSASSDADGDPLTYAWSLITLPEGSAAALSDATGATTVLTTDLAGTYEARLIVNDGVVNSDPDSVLVTASTAVNAAPIADAGPDQSVVAGVPVTLDGSASSDPNGNNISYLWSLLDAPEGSTAALSDPALPAPGFTPDLVGGYIAQLVVSDGALESEPATVTVVAAEGNAIPVAHAGDDRTVAIGTLVELDGTASSDANDDPLTYAWNFNEVPEDSVLASSDLAGADTATPSFTPDEQGNYVIRLIVTDSSGATSAADAVTITAQPTNNGPIADAGNAVTVEVGEAVIVDGSGSSDPDGDELTYEWSFAHVPDGSSLTDVDIEGDDDALAAFTPDVAGQYVVRLVVDDEIDQDIATVTITAE